MSNLENAIKLFLTFRRAEGLAERTLKDYHAHLAAFSKRIPEGTEDYRAAALSYLSDDINPNTYNIRFKYIKKFFDWSIEEGLFSCAHPLTGLKKRRPVGRIVHIEPDTLAELLRLPNKRTFTGLRDYALILFSLDCGARPGESLKLRVEDFDLAGLLVTIPAPVAKTRQARTIPITIQTGLAVQALMAAHHPAWKDAPVFCSESGTEYLPNSWGHRLRGYSARLGKTITPYYLRHAAALGMLRRGMNVFALRDMMGHSDLTTTQKYLALTLDDLRKAHAESSLVNEVAPRRHRVRKI
ncbi:MAG: tyrosine-type recombinase/integrase [Fretibacterium sp.]|nr:tyrosine-type recombinase/integrase [Fretibacterium sp.]